MLMMFLAFNNVENSELREKKQHFFQTNVDGRFRSVGCKTEIILLVSSLDNNLRMLLKISDYPQQQFNEK